MFKVPEWGDDVPKNNTNLRKLVSKGLTKVKQKIVRETPKVNCVQKTRFKTKSKTKAKVKTFKKQNRTVRPHKTNKIKQVKGKSDENTDKLSEKLNNVIRQNEKAGNSSIDIQNYDSDNIDELILNAKKSKLNETYQNEDNEESLFSESMNKGNNNVTIEKKPKIKPAHKSNVENKIHKTKKKKIASKSQNKDSEENYVTVQKCNVKNNIKIEIQDKVDVAQELNKEPLHSSSKVSKEDYKKQHLKKLLTKQSNRRQITTSGNKLRDRMMERLNAAKFRFLNEKLYTSSGSEAQKLFQSDPEAFQTYHQGYQQQLKKWPVNPLDVIVKKIQNMPKSYVVADLGCGRAALAQRVAQAVHSFDLVAAAPGVRACDMARTPLLTQSVDCAVYCLALMGTDLTQYLLEANRILKIGGHLLIAEVESRFADAQGFARDVQRLGFALRALDRAHDVFLFMHFTKARDAPAKKARLPPLALKPCVYKRR